MAGTKQFWSSPIASVAFSSALSCSPWNVITCGQTRQIETNHSHTKPTCCLTYSCTGGGICSESFPRRTYLLKVGDHLEHVILAGLCQLPSDQQFGVQGGAVGCASHDCAQRRVHNDAEKGEAVITSNLSEATRKSQAIPAGRYSMWTYPMP